MISAAEHQAMIAGGKGNNNFQERNVKPNVAEFLFEYYCAEKGYHLHRLGSDPSKPIPKFFDLNPYIRNLPDYIVTTPETTYLVNVKGSANFKHKDYLMMEELKKHYGSEKSHFVYAFQFLNEDPRMMTIEMIRKKYDEAGEDKQWSDGVIYRTLKL